ncbi:phage shock protein E [Pseudomonas pohangensis]|jgi:phage shock protein E|uniref:Phage shock protein E n=1 Tax=Pseudomonas pohangensis TaxID=364197 RepID=A0A1H2EWB7_9PSED|nr:rhodanese-like domain-containing protein [Pseudomonas pohangensis]SDT99436.1 phage shock protein E [Pseudomonas pohangensis]
MRALLLALPLSLLVLLGGPVLAETADERVVLNALSQPDAILIDVRTPEEFAQGALPGARQIEFDRIAGQIAAIAPDKNQPIVLYCRSGRRSGIAQQTLHELGYHNVTNAGGYEKLSHAVAAQQTPACSNC